MAHGKTHVPEIRKGDTVVVLAGKDAGKRGVVDRVISNPMAAELAGGPKTGQRHQYWKPKAARPTMVVIEGINVAKRHTKPRQSAGRTDRMPKVQQGGILDIAQPLDVSKVMLICPKCSRPTRIKHTTLGDGHRVRVCGHCGQALEVTTK